MSTPAPVAARPPVWTVAITHDGAGPQAGTQLAGQTSRHLSGVSAAIALKSPDACSDLLLDTRGPGAPVVSFIRQGYVPLSPLMFVKYMHGMLKRCRGLDAVQLDDIKVASRLFADDVVILPLSDRHLHCAPEWFTARV
ncbi:unnamed protein product [Pleuronectes platessa]|uniref:Reverse transcriptase domain-containing protein n=1 Tax=Pleuronectes platessa TaxID=8262 RepID=A0A9N7TSP7_PLEPL|nr:unnamed protein product [Pleuronectes platessa]